MVSYEHDVSSGWSLIRPALYQVGLFTRVSLYQHCHSESAERGKKGGGGGGVVSGKKELN